METIELRITIDKEAVEAIMTLLGALADRMSDKVADKERESTKEKDNTITVCMTDMTGTNKESITLSRSCNADKNINNNDIDMTDSCKHGDMTDSIIVSNNEIPTLDQVTAYIAKKGYKMSPNKFYEYYKNRDWKTKMGISMAGRWQEFIDTWASHEYDKPMPKNYVMGMGTQEERRAAHPFVPSFEV